MERRSLESGSLNRLRYQWNSFRVLGPNYALWWMKKAPVGSSRNRRDLSNFTGCGIEIGGPSQFFQCGEEFPIYSVAQNVDNVNYSSRTFWEGALREGQYFSYNVEKGAGHQFIREASELSDIPSYTYDFIASCHTLEHCANPIKALYEWRRVLKDDGWFALVLPHKAGTFDHRRRVTAFEHLLKDYSDKVTEDDRTHFPEILEKHDLRLDPGQKSRAGFEKWINDNSLTRGAHHHVFDPELAIKLVDYTGFEVTAVEVIMPYHIFIVAQKSSRPCSEKEQARAQILQSCCATSPFKSDRQRETLASRRTERGRH